MVKIDFMRRTSEMHAHPTRLSNFILGGQDGLVNVLGIVLGVSAATSDIRILLVASLAALAAESISMGAVAYTSTLARRMHYLKEVEREKEEMRTMPKMERQEVHDVFKNWGYRGRELEDMTDKICKNKTAWLEFMMAHELKLAPVDKSEAKNSGLVVLASTIFGSIIPVLPFLVTSNVQTGAIAATVISAVVLFIIGVYEAKTTVGSLWKSGLRMLVIGMAAGLAGYLVGRALGATPV